MAKVELFRVPGLSQFMRAFGAFPVRRNEADLSALRQAVRAMDAGLAVCIFPEGTRAAASARLREGWPGAALLAMRHDVPILPIAITGSQHMALPRLFLRPFRRYEITLTVGEPFRIPRPQRLNAESTKAGTTMIMTRIAALLPPEYRGYYGGTVTEAAPTAVETGD
jgi:1-acyl-sn-glycerol-3-phosphate acyltransferase